MAEPFLAEIRIVSFTFPPKGWALCDGQLLPINQNQALFALLGTTYGGNGQTTFALPDLRGRAPLQVGASAGGSAHTLGERAGETAHTLTLAELPVHAHAVNVTNQPGTQASPAGNFLAAHRGGYIEAAAAAMHAGAISNTGGSQAHLNMQPFLALNFCIALQGIFPSQS